MIKILVTGDFCPHKRIERICESGNYSAIYNDFYSELENNDINITNLECPLTEENKPIDKDGPNLKVKEECVKAIVFGKFNMITLSNNHIMDFGEKGLMSTIRLFEQNNIDFLGAGKNLEEASRILFKKIKGKLFAFLNFSEIEFSTATLNYAGSNPLNPVKNYYDIKSAREKADFVIVIVHGGHENYSLPSPRMVETYRFFVDVGADIVVGHHTHCFSGYEKHNKGLIFYSLGNFIFDSNNERNSDWNYGYGIKFFINERKISFKVIPYKQCNELPGVFQLENSEYKDFEKKLSDLNLTISQESELLKEWWMFSNKVRSFYLTSFECINSKIYKLLREKRLIPGTLTKKKKLQLLNFISCEAHRDLSIESLKF